jgi:hypothetical protein
MYSRAKAGNILWVPCEFSALSALKLLQLPGFQNQASPPPVLFS